MPIIFYHTAHTRLWDWLAANPGRVKHDWPKWVFNGGMVASARFSCFACETAKQLYIQTGVLLPRICNYCPFVWKDCTFGDGCAHCDNFENDGPAKGVFRRWEDMTLVVADLAKRHHSQPAFIKEEALLRCTTELVQYARIIRDMPLNTELLKQHNVRLI